MMTCVWSVDVEDWFHILDLPSTPDILEWNTLPSRVNANFAKLLDIFDAGNIRVTCFFLGWVARRYPHLVREAIRRGHEIASHGYGHRLVYELTPSQFYDDIVRAREILEDLTGREVLGYRAPGFSVPQATGWFFETLIRAGYLYDSSVFPGRRGHGGLRTGRLAPGPTVVEGGLLVEFPISVTPVCGRPICFFGGGYLRLFPHGLIRTMALRVLNDNRPVIFYVHPREVDPDHPRLPMPLIRRFKSYVNLKTTEAKIKDLLAEFQFTTFREFLAEHAESFGLADRLPAALVAQHEA
jgi:polysaccharide deacetylase family protein (PEP-CTERM system associated)